MFDITNKHKSISSCEFYVDLYETLSEVLAYVLILRNLKKKFFSQRNHDSIHNLIRDESNYQKYMDPMYTITHQRKGNWPYRCLCNLSLVRNCVENPNTGRSTPTMWVLKLQSVTLIELMISRETSHAFIVQLFF